MYRRIPWNHRRPCVSFDCKRSKQENNPKGLCILHPNYQKMPRSPDIAHQPVCNCSIHSENRCYGWTFGWDLESGLGTVQNQPWVGAECAQNHGWWAEQSSGR